MILAAEDIGLANPNALLLANATFDTIQKIGMPEGRIPLTECTIYLATSAKSNSAYMAIAAALEAVDRTGNLPVPLHLRNAPTSLMKKLGYGESYKYAHDYPGNFVRQQFLPDTLAGNNSGSLAPIRQRTKCRPSRNHVGVTGRADEPTLSIMTFAMRPMRGWSMLAI